MHIVTSLLRNIVICVWVDGVVDVHLKLRDKSLIQYFVI